MARAKSWILVFVWIVGTLLFASCSKPKHMLRLECEEGGWYPVDVAIWTEDKDEEGNIFFWYTVRDATIEMTATYYADPGLGLPTYPADHALHLDSYTVRWPSGTLPQLRGSLDVLLPSDLSGGTAKGTKFGLLVCPAVNKDTLPILYSLRGDPMPDEPNPFVGQEVLKGTIDLVGHDVLTDEEVTSQLAITAAFADYLDPNSYH